MPPRTPKPCKHPHCAGLTTDKSGYCDKHRHTGWETHQAGRSRHQRGYGSDWDKTRLIVLRRDKYLCQECRSNKRATPANEVDHVIPKEHGGTDELDNLEAKCTPCHRKKTAKEKKNTPQKTNK